ncbi:MAG: acyl-[acyl-carrier-protein] thioesterase [Streptococcaceae bacterium]|jgi:medium-chain acyl-[acyl-carrier-protein] hydrolase|nr:acyl-[acyl-carrier-protein] thioesterase [Streptococcaceae bacterium]
MLTYSKNYTVPYYESDANGNMKLSSLFNVALQVSGEQSHALGVSDDWVRAQYQCLWVIVAHDAEIRRLPLANEQLKIETVARAYNKFFCYRDFNVYGAKGEQLLTISTTFVLMDAIRRKVARIPDELIAPFEADKLNKVIRGHQYQTLKSATMLERTYHVRFNDIDLNGHVNNSKYLDWMTDSLGFDFLSQYVPQTIHLKYTKEVMYGVDVSSKLLVDGSQTYHEIVTTDHHAQAELSWRSK